MDFSILSDDQLLDLLKGAMTEAIHRGGAIAAAAQGEVLSAKERAQIEFRVAEKLRAEAEARERERIAKEAEAKIRAEALKKEAQQVESTWSSKAAAIAAIRQWGYNGDFEINIWSNGADRRVYFQESNGRRCDWKWCLYLTGNKYHPPGDLDGEGNACWFDDRQDQLKSFLKAIAESWKGDVSIPCKAGDVEPSQAKLKKYLAAIGIEEKANV
jgi:hypothetical protein